MALTEENVCLNCGRFEPSTSQKWTRLRNRNLREMFSSILPLRDVGKVAEAVYANRAEMCHVQEEIRRVQVAGIAGSRLIRQIPK